MKTLFNFKYKSKKAKIEVWFASYDQLVKISGLNKRGR